MAIDLTGIPDAPPIDLSGIPDEPVSHGSLLDSIATTLSRPGAALRNAFMADLTSGRPGKTSDAAFSQGFNSPASVPSLASVIPEAPQANPFLAGLQTNVAAVAGATGDIGADPLMLGIPGLGIAGRALGDVAEKALPGAAKWLANETRTINPAWNARLNPSPSLDEILGKLDTAPAPSADITPASPQDSWVDVPQSAEAATVDLPNAQGQLGLPGFQNTPRNLLTPPDLAPEPLGPIRDQGQQEFDFTQGPAAPVVSTPPKVEPAQPVIMPQDNVIQLSAQVQKEIDDISRMPNGARPEPYRGLTKPQIQDLFVQRVANKPVKQTVLPPEFDIAHPVMKSLKTSTNLADPFEMGATEEDAVRRQQLIEDRNSVNDLVTKDEAATEDPSTLADIKTVLSDIKLKAKDQNIIELHAGPKPPDFELGPEGQAALERLKGKVIETMKATGKSAVQVIQEMHPNLSTEEAMILAKAGKIGNLNLRQYPDQQKQQLKDLYAGKENKLKTKPMTQRQIVEKAKELTSFPKVEAIKKSGEGSLAAEKVGSQMAHIAKMQAIAEDPKLSAQDTIKRVMELDTEGDKKVSTEIARALNSGNIPLEAQQEKLDAFRKIVDRLRTEPNAKGILAQLKSKFPEAEHATTVAEVFKEVYRNSLTSSPVTWGINAGSNYGNVATRIPKRVLEITAEKVISKLSGNPTSATYKEVGAMLKGLSNSLKGEKLPEALKSQTFTDKYTVSPLETLAANAKTKVGQTALDVTGKIIHTPAKIMQAADEHAKNMLGMMEMEASKARGEDVLNDQHAIERIIGSQARGSFQDEMSSIGKWVGDWRNYWARKEPTAFNQAMDMATYSLQPFIQTVDRIIAGGINHSILGAGTTALKAITGKYTGAIAKGVGFDPMAREKMSRDMAAVMIGAPLFAWTWSQFAQGNIIGAAPQGTAGQETFSNAGKTEYSIKKDGLWISLRYIPEPIATAIQINLALLQGGAEAKNKQQGMSSAIFNGVKNVGYMLGTKQYLGGMNSLMNAVTTKESDDVSSPTDAGNSLNRNTVMKKIVPAIAVPAIAKDAGVVINTLRGKPRVMADTAMQAAQRRTGFTDNMVPELNTFGEAVTHPMMGKVNNDPAYALAEKFPPQPVDRTVDGVKLSQQDYHDLKQSVGQQRKRVYEALANSKGFTTAPEGAQQLVVEDMVAEADKIGSLPEKVRELQSDPLYYNRRLRTLLNIQKPGGERHFPSLK